MTPTAFRGARIVVTGAVGFLGSHLSGALLAEGADAIGIDNLSTGRRRNPAHLDGHGRLTLQCHDVTEHITVDGTSDLVLHAAIGLATGAGAGCLLASTSEVHGDPDVYPQPESHHGSADPIGPRGVDDEAKRFAEALTFACHRTHGIAVYVVRIFDTSGPRMRTDDGRAVPTFIRQALAGQPLAVYGDGSQTRSRCDVDDLIAGMPIVLRRGVTGPIDLGHDHEVTLLAVAEAVMHACGSHPGNVHLEWPADDPEVRCPATSLARHELDSEGCTSRADGPSRTVAWDRRAH